MLSNCPNYLFRYLYHTFSCDSSQLTNHTGKHNRVCKNPDLLQPIIDLGVAAAVGNCFLRQMHQLCSTASGISLSQKIQVLKRLGQGAQFYGSQKVMPPSSILHCFKWMVGGKPLFSVSCLEKSVNFQLKSVSVPPSSAYMELWHNAILWHTLSKNYFSIAEMFLTLQGNWETTKKPDLKSVVQFT